MTSGSQLRIGMTLQGRQALYRLVRRLGSGRFSEVWQADVIEGELWSSVAMGEPYPVRQVALKVMNRGSTPSEQRHFESEVEILNQLRSYECENNLLVNGHSLIPTVFDALTNTEIAPHPAFFVETLATGQPLDELMGKRGAFPEPEALTIVAQFCRVLEALHKGVGRSYLDFQTKNVFWDEEKQRILVIDWNVLSKQGEAGFRRDLATAERMLCRLLMGVEPPNPGSPRTLAQPLVQWEQLSLGAQEILARAFHPTADRRFSSVTEFRRRQEEIVRLWKLPPGHLVAMVETRSWDKTSLQRDRCHQAAIVLSVAKRQEPIPLEVASRIADLGQQLESWMTGREHLEIGLRLFDAKDYTPTLEDFGMAAEEA